MSRAVPTEGAGARERLRSARRALYRDAIVEAAEQEFARRGYEAAKVQAIAKSAGVSLATFYSAFPSKWEVFRALQQDRLGALMQRVGPAVMQAADPFDRLCRGLDGYLRFHMEQPDFLRVQLRDEVPWGTADSLRTPEQTRAWEAGLKLLTAAFRQAMDAGLLVDEDPELCARTATAMGQVRLVWWLSRDPPPPANDVARGAMDQFVRTFARPERLAELLTRVAQSSGV